MARLLLVILACAVVVVGTVVVMPLLSAGPQDPRLEDGGAPATPRAVDHGEARITGAELVVPVYPGQDLQRLVGLYGEGTRFHLTAGVHRGISVVPRDGQIFTGSGSDTVVSGAVVLDPGDFVAAGGAWYVDGQEQEGDDFGAVVEGRERDAHPEDVIVDGDRRLRHVGAVDELAPDAFFFDYDADRIWLGADPTSFELIETTVLPYAFAGTGVRDVVISDMVVEKYASPYQYGALGGDASTRFTRGWTFTDLEVRLNHAGGLLVGPGSTVARVHAHSNGQWGIAGNGSNLFNQDGQAFWEGHVTVVDSEIERNLQLGYDWMVEGGGTKFSLLTAGITFSRNHVHDNAGPGVWLDVYNEDSVVRDNLVVDNEQTGIFYEISFGETVIEDNVVLRNGLVDGRAGIEVSGSRDVVVRDNLVQGNGGGIRVIHDGERYRLAQKEYEYDIPVESVEIRDNLVVLGRGPHGFTLVHDDPRWYDEADFSGNRYVVTGDDVEWQWDGVDDLDGFLAAHPDDGPVLDEVPDDRPAADALRLEEMTVGPR